MGGRRRAARGACRRRGAARGAGRCKALPIPCHRRLSMALQHAAARQAKPGRAGQVETQAGASSTEHPPNTAQHPPSAARWCPSAMPRCCCCPRLPAQGTLMGGATGRRRERGRQGVRRMQRELHSAAAVLLSTCVHPAAPWGVRTSSLQRLVKGRSSAQLNAQHLAAGWRSSRLRVAARSGATAATAPPAAAPLSTAHCVACSGDGRAWGCASSARGRGRAPCQGPGNNTLVSEGWSARSGGAVRGSTVFTGSPEQRRGLPGLGVAP